MEALEEYEVCFGLPEARNGLLWLLNPLTTRSWRFLAHEGSVAYVPVMYTRGSIIYWQKCLRVPSPMPLAAPTAIGRQDAVEGRPLKAALQIEQPSRKTCP
jgi:hypothetical protein